MGVCNLSHVILAYQWFCLAHYMTVWANSEHMTTSDLKNGTKPWINTKCLSFWSCFEHNVLSIHFVDRSFIQRTLSFIFISLSRSFIFRFALGVPQFSGLLCMRRQVCRINAIHSANTQTHLQNWKLHSICLWIMMNILCDTFDENESFNKFTRKILVCANERRTHLNSTLSFWCAIDVTSRVKSRVSFRWFISGWRWKLKAEIKMTKTRNVCTTFEWRGDAKYDALNEIRNFLNKDQKPRG